MTQQEQMLLEWIEEARRRNSPVAETLKKDLETHRARLAKVEGGNRDELISGDGKG